MWAFRPMETDSRTVIALTRLEMGNKSKSLDKQIEQEVEYVAFLKKRLDSSNFKANVSKEELELTKKKYDKSKLKLRFLLDDNKNKK